MKLDSILKLRGLPAPPRMSFGARIAAPNAQPRPQQWIWFSNLPFAGPTPFDIAVKRNYGGLYAILVFDPRCRPLPYRAIYIGEAGDMGERVCRNHEKYQSWTRAAGGGSLFVAFHAMAYEAARKVAETRLIRHYSPECNVTHNSLAALLGY